MSTIGPHASETTSHGLIIGTQPKLVPTCPVARPKEPLPASGTPTQQSEERQRPPSTAASGIWDDRSWGEYQK